MTQRHVLVLSFLVATLAHPGEAGEKPRKAGQLDGSRTEESYLYRLTSEGQSALRAYISAGELADLQRPNFETYRTEAEEFYDAFRGCLPWIRGEKPSPQARDVIGELRDAEYKGLDPEDYDGALWEARLEKFESAKPLSEGEFVRFDLALTISTMRFLSDLHIGRVNPSAFKFSLDLNHKSLDLSEFLRLKIVNAAHVRAAIESVEPQYATYRRTLVALREYIDFARRDDGEALPAIKTVIKPGDVYAGVPRLRRLLRLIGDLPESADKGTQGTTYEGHVVEAVKQFQTRHGLDPNGWIDARTLRELNTAMSRRVVQLELTLERWRWLPKTISGPTVIVNIPEFQLHAVDAEHRVNFSMKVVVGKSYGHQTPVFESEIIALTFRPYWNVPMAIQQQELLPEFERKPSYFADNGYEIVDASGKIVPGDPNTEEMKEQLRSGHLYLRQEPGPKNSLGLLKFEMPNPFDVYLHDTPATELFSRSRRDFSHGCIRVEDPVRLAEWLLGNKPEWTPERIRSLMNGEETLRVNLERPVPVWVLYGTAVVLEDGKVRFFRDIYGQDAALERALLKE